jgi:D-glycero-D-manno-heptose 1,7-bisphosphate phosphatase
MAFNFRFAPGFAAPRKTAFLDRDGVINIDHAYVGKKELFDFVPGALEGMRLLSRAGFALVIITNQSGIGRGKYSLQDFAGLSFWLAGRCEAAAAPLSGIFFCPHHPEKALAPFLLDCGCRKPAPGMILEAARTLNLDLRQSLFIGDKDSDMRAALAAGIPRRILLQSNGSAPFDACTNSTEQARDLLSVGRLICP